MRCLVLFLNALCAVSVTSSASTTSTTSTASTTDLDVEGTLVCGNTVTGDTSESSIALGKNDHGHLWKFDVNQSGFFIFQTCGSSISDTMLKIYGVDTSNSNGLTLNPFATNDDWSGTYGCSSIYHAVLGVTLNANTYYILVEGYESENVGNYAISTLCNVSSSQFIASVTSSSSSSSSS